MLKSVTDFFNFTDEEKSVSRAEISQENIRRAFYLSIIAIPASFIHIIVFSLKLGKTSGEEYKWSLLIIICHTVILLSTLVTASLIYLFSIRTRKSTKIAHVCIHLIIILLLWGGAFITSVDQHVTSSITPYLISCFIAGLVILMRPMQAFIYFLLSYFVFFYGISLTQLNPNILTSNLVNGLSASVLGLCLSFILWKGNVTRILQKRQIEKQNLELIESNSNKVRFFSILGHDLKDPVSSMLGLLELLLANSRKFDIEKIENILTIIKKSAQNTYFLLDDLLLWSRSQTGKLNYQPINLSFQVLCSEIVTTLKPIADAKNISINYFSADNLIVYADINMFKTIMRNLVTNAIKFTRHQGRIDIYAIQRNSRTTVSVSDNGVGISSGILPKIFDITQTSSTKGTANESGTGLGLYLCKEFVEKHGGKIWVESETGKGSIFYFSLPLNGENKPKYAQAPTPIMANKAY